MKTIEVIVSTDGKVEVQTRGFAGRACLAASRFLESALGATTSDRLSSEFYATTASFDHERAASQQRRS